MTKRLGLKANDGNEIVALEGSRKAEKQGLRGGRQKR